MKRITVTVSEETHRELRHLTFDEGLSMQEVIEAVLRRVAANPQKFRKIWSVDER